MPRTLLRQQDLDAAGVVFEGGAGNQVIEHCSDRSFPENMFPMPIHVGLMLGTELHDRLITSQAQHLK